MSICLLLKIIHSVFISKVDEEMKISLSIRIKPLQIEAMDSDELKSKIQQIWDTIVNLETDK